jgi:hypothetical protein
VVISGANRRLKNVRLGSGRGGPVDVIRLIVAREAIVVREIAGRCFPPAIYRIIRANLSWRYSSIVAQIPQITPSIACVEREVATVDAQIASVTSDVTTTLTCSYVVPDVARVASDFTAISSNLSRIEAKLAAVRPRSVVISASVRGRCDNSRSLC